MQSHPPPHPEKPPQQAKAKRKSFSSILTCPHAQHRIGLTERPSSRERHRPWCPQACFSRVFSLLSPDAAAAQQFSPLLKYVIPEALPPSLMGSARAGSGAILEPPGTASVAHGGEASGSFSQKPPLQPLRYQNRVTQTQYRINSS